MAGKKKSSKSKKVDLVASSISRALTKALEPIFGRFDGIDTRFDGIDKRFDGIDRRFDMVDKEINGTRVLIEQLDKRFSDAMMPSEMTSEHNLKIKDHGVRISTLEQDTTVIKAAIKNLKEV